MRTATPSPRPTLRGISSMATRQLLAELLAMYALRSNCVIAIESVGGVDAVKRVQAGESFDLVFLASEAIDSMIVVGHIDARSKLDLVRCGVAVAVRAGAQRPDISSEKAVRQAVLAARSISYSTGPSGVALAKLFEKWGIAEIIRERLVQPPPGTSVGALVARGEVELGFQQLSELIHVQGIALVGPLPPEIQVTTTFSAGIGAGSTQAPAARDLLDFMASALAVDAKRRQGMEPA